MTHSVSRLTKTRWFFEWMAYSVHAVTISAVDLFYQRFLPQRWLCRIVNDFDWTLNRLQQLEGKHRPPIDLYAAAVSMEVLRLYYRLHLDESYSTLEDIAYAVSTRLAGWSKTVYFRSTFEGLEPTELRSVILTELKRLGDLQPHQLRCFSDEINTWLAENQQKV